MGKELEVDVRNVDLSVKKLSMNRSRARVSRADKLTAKEHNCRAMGKFQNVLLLIVTAVPRNLIVPRDLIISIPRRSHVGVKKRKRKFSERGLGAKE